jgi:hypothetical protein
MVRSVTLTLTLIFHPASPSFSFRRGVYRPIGRYHVMMMTYQVKAYPALTDHPDDNTNADTTVTQHN